ncbi:hypothetical protein ACEPPN_004073 [Leptodophora sp. 'Broadleaf-Isolate-01']
MAPKQYKRRVALFLAWADDPQNTGKAQDPMGINKEMESLRRVLANGYGFDIFVHRIELYSPMLAVRDKVRSFIRGYSNPDTLLLLYYGGHGSYSFVHRLMSLSFFVAATPYQVTQIWRSIALQMEEQRRSLLLVPWVGRQQLSSEYFGVTSLNLKTMKGNANSEFFRSAPQVISLLEKRFVSGQHTTIRHVNSDLPKGIDRFTEGIFGRGRRLPARRKFSEAAYLQLHGASPKVSIVLTPVVTTPMFAEEPRYAKSSLIAKFWRLCGHGPLDSWKAVAGEATGRIY